MSWYSSIIVLIGMVMMVKVSDGYYMGVATSAYQIEGYNPGVSIWDVYTKRHHLREVGNATDHYHRYREDIQNIHDLGFQHYRFSFSWTRLMPRERGQMDTDGVRFYHAILDECERWNITPHATLYHWDLPQYIDDDFDGWLNKEMVTLFLEYSQAVLEEYGSRIQHWMTINEPLTTSLQGYGSVCNFAPGRCESPHNFYLSARYQLLAHAAVANFFQENYPEGEIAIVLNANWYNGDAKQAARLMDETLGIFLEPLLYGRFPLSLENAAPPFTVEEQEALMRSFTYIAINHYTSYNVDVDGAITTSPEWARGQSPWLYDAPSGMHHLLHHLHDHYGLTSIPIIITECGFSQINDGIVDLGRARYLMGYMAAVQQCVEEGMTNVKGFFIWSLLDNFEWASGYNETFGIVKVDRSSDDYTRTNKVSAKVIKAINNAHTSI